MDDHAQPIDIGAGVSLAPAILLRRGVARRAQQQRVLRLARLEVAGDAEVDQLQRPARLKHDVARFQVAEDDRRVLLVEIVEHHCQLPGPDQRLPLVEATRRSAYDRIQRLTGHVFHDQIGVIALAEVVHDAGNAGVVEPSQHLRLAAKGVDGRLPVGRGHLRRVHLFHGHGQMAQTVILGQIDRAHAPLAQQASYLVAAL